MKFNDKHTGFERKRKYQNRGFYHIGIDDSWAPIFDIERTFAYRRNTIQRIQFSLEPSAGRTVHRAQGITLDEVVVDLSQKTVKKKSPYSLCCFKQSEVYRRSLHFEFQ